MAQKSTIKSMRTVSTFLFLAIAGLITAGAVKIEHGSILNGTELIGWMFVPLSLLLGFTLPTRCKVRRTNRKACGNWSYGLLFGCRSVPRHWSEKFLFRLGLDRDEVTPPADRSSKTGYSVHQSAPPQSKPIKVTVEEGILTKCGSWVGLVSGIIGIIQAIITLTH